MPVIKARHSQQQTYCDISCTQPYFYSAVTVCPHAQKLHALAQLPLPVAFTLIVYLLLWRKSNNKPGHTWIRDTICENLAKVVRTTTD